MSGFYYIVRKCGDVFRITGPTIDKQQWEELSFPDEESAKRIARLLGAARDDGKQSRTRQLRELFLGDDMVTALGLPLNVPSGYDPNSGA